MKKMLLIAWGVGLAMQSVAAWAGDTIKSIWIVQPVEVPQEEIEVAVGGEVLHQQLLPLGVIEIGSDVKVKGRIIGSQELHAGDKLIMIASDSNEAKYFCTINPDAKGAAAVANAFFFGGAGQSQYCFQDKDNNGYLDSSFPVKNVGASIPMINQKIGWPMAIREIDPIPYTVVSLDALPDKYYISIKYTGSTLLNSKWFTLCYGTENVGESCLSGDTLVKMKKLPAQGEVSGAQFQIVSEDNSKLKIKILNSIPVQPFVMTRVISVR